MMKGELPSGLAEKLHTIPVPDRDGFGQVNNSNSKQEDQELPDVQMVRENCCRLNVC